jgi:hypothetical protein
VAVTVLFGLAVVRPLPLLRIVAVCVATTIAYGVLQDQVSARLCPEYFTVAHPPIEGLTDPTLVGLAWGFLGSWWGGLMMGGAVGLTATLGSRPVLTARDLPGPLLVAMVAVALGTLIAGGAGFHNGRLANIAVGEPFASRIPPERHLVFFSVACAHFGTYTTAIRRSPGASTRTSVGRQPFPVVAVPPRSSGRTRSSC